MASRQPYYSLFRPSTLSSELVKMTFDHQEMAGLIDKWFLSPLEHPSARQECYTEWIFSRREQKYDRNQKQLVIWNKGELVAENIFCRTVDTSLEQSRIYTDDRMRYRLTQIDWSLSEGSSLVCFVLRVANKHLRAWTTNVYYHSSIHDRKRSTIRVVSKMVRTFLLFPFNY